MKVRTKEELPEDYERIPESTVGGLKRYVEDRIPPGGFLQAVLRNDFVEAVGRADRRNSKALKEIAMFVYNEIPSKCWGSREAVEQWLDGEG